MWQYGTSSTFNIHPSDSPEHVGRAEHHVKLPAVQVRRFLRHLRRL